MFDCTIVRLATTWACQQIGVPLNVYIASCCQAFRVYRNKSFMAKAACSFFKYSWSFN